MFYSTSGKISNFRVTEMTNSCHFLVIFQSFLSLFNIYLMVLPLFSNVLHINDKMQNCIRFVLYCLLTSTPKMPKIGQNDGFSDKNDKFLSLL